MGQRNKEKKQQSEREKVNLRLRQLANCRYVRPSLATSNWRPMSRKLVVTLPSVCAHQNHQQQTKVCSPTAATTIASATTRANCSICVRRAATTTAGVLRNTTHTHTHTTRDFCCFLFAPQFFCLVCNAQGVCRKLCSHRIRTQRSKLETHSELRPAPTTLLNATQQPHNEPLA